jgi:nucleoside-diphosphate-sugar epimerase
VDEAMRLRPAGGSGYAESKAAAERGLRRLAARGLPVVILRPARVYGPFAGTFITRPIEALARGRLRLVGRPDGRANMVYVDNLVEAIVRALAAPDGALTGEAFNICDPDDVSWREFYGFFAEHLGHEPPPVDASGQAQDHSNRRGWGPLGWPGLWSRGVRNVVVSPEFRALARKLLETDPIGCLPRWALERFPRLERLLRRLVRADSSLPVYRRAGSASGDQLPDDTIRMGSADANLPIDKARRLLGFEPTVPREQAMQLTLDWIRHARITDQPR